MLKKIKTCIAFIFFISCTFNSAVAMECPLAKNRRGEFLIDSAAQNKIRNHIQNVSDNRQLISINLIDNKANNQIGVLEI